MTTANLSYTTGTLLTWSNQSNLWSDEFSQFKSWDLAYSVLNYTMAVGEDVTIGESINKSASISRSETLNFVESNSKNAYVAISVGLAISESTVRGIGFFRSFNESIAFAVVGAKSPHISKSDAFGLLDSWRRQGDMIISDVMISSGDMTMTQFEDFLKYGNVPGYEKWRNFIPGDYEYREAMIRVVLESKNADRGLLTNLQATIDVPDVLDRGTATVTIAANGATVTFNRTFHITPEITLSTRSGMSSNPVVPEYNGVPTKTGMTVRLRDTVTGVFVTGSFTWAANGY